MTLRSVALAAVASLVDGDEAPEARFLLGQLGAVAGGSWAEGLEDCVRRPAGEDGHLLHLAGELDLTLIEVLSVALAAAVDDDPLVGRALAHVQAPVGGSRPMLGLLAAALAGVTPPGVRPIEALVTGGAVRSGLLTVVEANAPLPERAVAVPPPLGLALGGRDGTWPGATIAPEDGEDGSEVPLPQSLAREADRHAAGLRSPPGPALVLRTGSRAEGRAVAAAVARALRRRALFLETDRTNGLGPWLILSRLLPVFCLDLGPGERRVLPAVPLYRGPVLALCGPDGTVEGAEGPVLNWSLPVPPRAERRQLWQAALGDEGLADELARHHRHGTGRIAHLGRLARHQCTLRGGERPTREDVAAASWGGEGAGLDGLAQPLRDPVPDGALVLTPALRAELNLLLLRCRARDGLADGLGVSASTRYHPGVRALFVGPSGTGKTLAAGWLATRLGLPLYRVDLASVTSKYIGETEKNLAQLLARAEQAEVLLLFDEADSLFGKRTEVNEANDRFANAQTNYLLQRIESFDGITLLTSNSRGRFDPAFARRLDQIIDFPLPGPEERRGLWRSHLGEGHGLTPGELNRLAVTADLVGGDIRNAVLAAAVLAGAAGRPVAFEDVVEALAGEYRKLGRQMPAELRSR